MSKIPAITAYIPAAGKPNNPVLPHSILPDTMLPINGKPVISYILQDLLRRKINDAVLILNPSDIFTEQYVSRIFGNKLSIHFVYDGAMRGVGYSLHMGALSIPPKDRVLVYLGDTIYKGALSFKENFLIVSKEYKESHKWCFVEENNDSLTFIDKPPSYTGTGYILSGLYFFNKGKDFKKSLEYNASHKERVEMKDLLEKYLSYKNSFKLKKAQGWYDCGNVENYYRARIDFLKTRSFNSIEYDDLYGHITKKSSNVEKIKQEIDWYLSLPDKLKIFAPRLIDYSLNTKEGSYSIEFYGYQSLADIYLFGSMSLPVWEIVINRLLEITEIFKEHKKIIPKKDFVDIYVKKTFERLKELEKDRTWKRIMQSEDIEINGSIYKNISSFIPLIEEYAHSLWKKDHLSFIHGDLCLSNILFDPTSKILKLIDPRGKFGSQVGYGDIKYDLAKLRHSFSGHYDFIVSDLFHICEFNGSFDFEVYKDNHVSSIAEYYDKKLTDHGYDLNAIKFIEALLFISMIPLHSDSKDRQRAMYMTGIQLLNETLI